MTSSQEIEDAAKESESSDSAFDRDDSNDSESDNA